MNKENSVFYREQVNLTGEQYSSSNTQEKSFKQ